MSLIKYFNSIDFNHHENSIRYLIAGSLILSVVLSPFTLVNIFDESNWRWFLVLSVIANLIALIGIVVGLPLFMRIGNIHIVRRIAYSLLLVGLCFIVARSAVYSFKDITAGTKEYTGACEVQSKQSRYLITSYSLYPAGMDMSISIDYGTFETFDGKYNESTQRHQCNQEVRMVYLENNEVMIGISKK